MSSSLVRSPWLRVDEAAAYARVGQHDMRALVKSGTIPSHRFPGKCGTLVFAGDVDEYIMTLPSGAEVPERLRESPFA